MKKILIAAASLVLVFSSTAFAQKKGDMLVNGALGIQASSLGSTTGLDLLINAGYGFFFADNFVGSINVGLSHGRSTEGETASSTNTFDVSPQASYYLKLSDKFYYTPSIGVTLSFGKTKIVDASTKLFVWNAYLDFATFEYRLQPKFAIVANLGEMYFGNVNYKEQDINKAVFGFGLLSSCTLGARFYF